MQGMGKDTDTEGNHLNICKAEKEKGDFTTLQKMKLTFKYNKIYLELEVESQKYV